MTSKILSVAAVSLVLFGCGSGPSGRAYTIGNPEAGAAGSPTETGGNDTGTGGGATGGTGGSATGGSAGQATGGSTGGSETGGSGGSCVPKTCETIAAELTNYNPDAGVAFPQPCGIVSDGCSGYKDCTNPDYASNGGCPANYLCGRGNLTEQLDMMTGVSVENSGIPNICGGGCVEPRPNPGCTSSWGETGTVLFNCLVPPADGVSPLTNQRCEPYPNGGRTENLNSWCCSVRLSP